MWLHITFYLILLMPIFQLSSLFWQIKLSLSLFHLQFLKGGWFRWLLTFLKKFPNAQLINNCQLHSYFSKLDVIVWVKKTRIKHEDILPFKIRSFNETLSLKIFIRFYLRYPTKHMLKLCLLVTCQLSGANSVIRRWWHGLRICLARAALCILDLYSMNLTTFASWSWT